MLEYPKLSRSLKFISLLSKFICVLLHTQNLTDLLNCVLAVILMKIVNILIKFLISVAINFDKTDNYLLKLIWVLLLSVMESIVDKLKMLKNFHSYIKSTLCLRNPVMQLKNKKKRPQQTHKLQSHMTEFRSFYFLRS